MKGKNVAVYGGGSVAMDVATTARALGANKVYVIYRRNIEQMPAAKHDFEMAIANNVIFKPMSVVTELVGEKGKLTSLCGCETDWKKPNDTTSKNLIQVEGTEFKLKVDLFVTALGYEAEASKISDGISFDNKGLAKTKKDGVSTSNPAMFVGGDIVRGSALVVDAVADGKTAGQKIVKYLETTTDKKITKGVKAS